MDTIGGLLRKRREMLGYSLNELAGENHISPSWLSKLENDKSEPGVASAAKLARALKMEPTIVYNLFGLATRDQRIAALREMERLVGGSVTAEVPVLGADGEPTGETRRLGVSDKEGAFVFIGTEPPYQGDLIASRVRVPVHGVGVIAEQDGVMRAGTYRKAGKRRAAVEFPDGSVLDFPETVYVIIAHD